MRRPFEIFAVAVLLMSRWAVPAHAGPIILQFEQAGFAPLQIVDNQPGDSDPAVGTVLFIGGYGSFELNISRGTSQPTAGSGGLPELILDSITVNQTSINGTLTIWAADDDYNLGATPATALGSVSGSANGPVSIQSWVNPANLIGLSPLSPGFIPAGSAIVFGPPGPTFGPGSYGATDTVDVLLTGPFSIFHRAIINLSAPSSTTVHLNTRVSPVPEPASLVLLGSGLVGLAARKRRRQRRS